MANKRDDEGLLDKAGKVLKHATLREDNPRKSTNKKTYSSISDAKKNNFGYGKTKDEVKGYLPLSVSDQLRIAAEFDQAVLKITSFASGIVRALSHIEYISREYEIELEDQDGAKIKDKNEVLSLLNSWDSMYFDQRKNSRDTMNMVFSAPPGTGRDHFKTAVTEFLSDEFSGHHDYVFAEHQDTDHPHIHGVICMRSISGKKLDPRKKYLNQLRKDFAKKCRSHGIMLDASRRFERGLSGQSLKSSMVQMRSKRSVTPEADSKLIKRIYNEISTQNKAQLSGKSIIEKRSTSIKNHFYDTAKMLYQDFNEAPDKEENKNNLHAAKLLYDYAKNFNEISSRDELIRAKLLSEPGAFAPDFIHKNSGEKAKNGKLNHDFDQEID